MLELSPTNALDYLRSQGRLEGAAATVEALGGGVSNAVLRVTTSEETFVLKQSRTQLRTREPWFSDVERVFREQEVMQLLQPLLPAATVPEVLWCDRANYVFAMSAAPAEARVWKEMLLAGEVDLTRGEQAGVILGRLHEATSQRTDLALRLGDATVFEQLRVDPFYRRVQERRPEVAGAVGRLMEGMRSVREALCHGDYSPKNLLAHEAGFTLVDYETAHYGDPTMDLGFFLSHLLLKAVRRPAGRERFFELTRAFWRGYHREVSFQPARALEVRGSAHFAVCALARLDGTSPVDYLPEETKREAVRQLSRRVLGDAPSQWEDVLTLCEAECRSLVETT